MSLANKRILVIGSSSVGENGSGALGKSLSRFLSGSQLSFIGHSGWGLAGDSVKRFAGRPTQRAELDYQLTSFLPYDLVLVVMGSNPTGTSADIEDAMRWLKGRVEARGAKLLWIGPPVYIDAYSQKITNAYDDVGPKVFGSSYISSRNWTHPTIGRTFDDVHFTASGAQAWADGIVSWMDSRSSAKIGLMKPLLLAAVAAIAALFVSKQASGSFSEIIPGGRASGKRSSDFDSRQLKMGIKVEMEHTRNKLMAREIAMDHLVEDPKYYTKLAKAGL